MGEPEASSGLSSDRVSLYFNITTACNSACVFCASDSELMAAQSIPTDAIYTAFERHAIGSGDEVIINGGEPTVHPGLRTIIREAAGRGARIILFSNGRLLQNMDYARALLSPGVFRMSIPLYGSLPTLHDQVTRRAGSFEQTMQGIRNVFAIRSRIGHPKQIELKLLAARPLLPEWAATVDLIASELGLPDQMVLSGLILSKSVCRHRQYLIPTMADLNEHVNDALDRMWHWAIPATLWSIPLCLVDDRNLARYRRIAWKLKHSPDGAHFDPDWKCGSSEEIGSQDIYFDPDYPDGIEVVHPQSSSIPDTCKECILTDLCGEAKGFFAEVLDVSSKQRVHEGARS